MTNMGDQMKDEARRARREVLGWKNVLFGFSAYRGLTQSIGESVRNVRAAFDSKQFGDGIRSLLPESFAAAAARLRLDDEKLRQLEASLRLRSAWWTLGATLALISFMFAPVSPHPFVHAMAAAALIFLCLARSCKWYFRASQIHDRDLYPFETWLRSNRTVKRVLYVLAAVVIIVGVLLSGSAHAGPLGLHDFTPDANDPSVAALRQVFGGMVDTIIGSGDPHGDANDSALGAMMVPFNAMVLTISMLFVGYTTVRTLIDTAGSGEFMGRQKEVSKYVVGRILLGVGMLVPLGSGYSLIQYGMMWWGLQGAGAANSINSAALDYMGGNKANMVAQPQVPSAETFVRSALSAYVCMAAMNKQYAAAHDDTRIAMSETSYQLKPAEQGMWSSFKSHLAFNIADLREHPLLNLLPVVNSVHAVQTYSDYQSRRAQWETNHTYTAYRYSFDATGSNYTNPEGVCGTFNFSNPAGNDMNEDAITQSVVSAQTNAVRTILNSPDLASIANTIVDAAPAADASVDERNAIHLKIEALASTYSDAVVQAVEASGGITGLSDADWKSFVATMKQTGWAYLPSYYNQMIRANDHVQSALNAMPDFSYARIGTFASDMELTTYKDSMARLDEYLMTPADLITANAQKVGGVDLSKSWYADLVDQCIPKTADAEKAKDAAVANSTMESAFEPIRKCISVLPRRGIFQFTSSLMGGNLNHVVHIKSIGDDIISTGDGLLMANFLVSGATGNIFGSTTGISSAIQSIGGFLTSAIIALLIFGAVAAYYIPLIPYIFGTIAFVKWLTLVIESIIAGPVFAAAHVFPEGHEASGRAGPGYMLLLGLFLRPSLTVIGFYLSIIVAQPVSDLINVTYGNAVMGAEADSITGVTTMIAYVGIYVTMMTTVMHSVFSLINWVPDNVLRWIGGGLQAHGVGDQEGGEMKGNVVAAFRGGQHISTSGGAKPRAPGPGAGAPKQGTGDGGDKSLPEFSDKEVRSVPPSESP
ncbi:MAG: hypothetical protein EPN79_15820 [Burkholderiaceae bacterium]|nr:MAG: hypothetical protein EPN79_15820 [Burkholderiaceae bacterium]